ncbi:alpha/beta hydrolase [Streptomyces sp. HUAS MG91]|uniref:Alpha/beta hydrolase n=1 Tax=Streptomyces tabacisoli TaxID=3156398 RepID=A0AAU8J037_9ACTN
MQPTTFVLVHSPSVGPTTWHPVAARLEAAGHRARVPSLLHVGDDGPPFWPRVAEAVRAGLAGVPDDSPVVLVVHSNAGLFLPTIRAALDRPVAASVLVDAALPSRTGPTPAAPPELLAFLRPLADERGILPRWTDWWDEADITPLFAGLADPAIRRTVTDEQPTLPLSYYEQRIPVPAGWDDHPCSYLLFAPPYEETAADARERGWTVARLPGEHLHQIVDPAGVARAITELAASHH